MFGWIGRLINGNKSGDGVTATAPESFVKTLFEQKKAMGEEDFRSRILNSFLFTPHRDLTKLKDLHAGVLKVDPLFYGHLSAWYQKKGSVRDHKELFTSHLFISSLPEHREAGYVFLQKFPPYEVARIMDYCKKTLNKAPRCLKTAVKDYLKEREDDSTFFDSAVIRGRKHMKHLYASMHIKPSKRAQKILFDESPPKGSPLHGLKMLSREKDPVKQAEIIVKNKIPFPVAVGALKTITPLLLISLINSMSPQEVMNSLNFMKKRGALKNKEVKELIDQKLVEAKGDKRVSAYKAKMAAKAVGADEKMKKQLDDITEAQVKAKGSIKRPTALFIDKSSSMTEAIEVGKQVGSLVSGITVADLFVYAFDTMPYEIKPRGKSLADWENALKHISPANCTSIGCPFVPMTKKKEYVEQVIVITDGEENSNPRFVNAWKDYSEKMGIEPSVIVMKVRGFRSVFEQELAREGVDHQVYEFRGDYYSLPEIVPLLTHPSRLELLMEVMSTPLPERKFAKK